MVVIHSHTEQEAKRQGSTVCIGEDSSIGTHTDNRITANCTLSLSASLLSCNHSIVPTACVASSTSIGGIYVFQENNPPLLCRSPPAGRELEEEKKTKHWAADKTGQSQTGKEQEVERQINVSGLKQTDIREETGREITAEARNQVGWKTLEAIHSSHTPSLIRKSNIERGLNWIKGRK